LLAISKSDLAPFAEPLAARLDLLNPLAERLVVTGDADPASILFFASDDPHPNPPPPAGEGGAWRPVSPTPADEGEALTTGRKAPSPAGGGGLGWGSATLPHEHSHGVATFTVVLEAPVTRLQFAMALGGLAQARGYDLLRVKGIVAFADRPDRPAIVQAAQHAMFEPQWLDDWPDEDRRSRLVFVVHDIAPAEILAHFHFATPRVIGGSAIHDHTGA